MRILDTVVDPNGMKKRVDADASVVRRRIRKAGILYAYLYFHDGYSLLLLAISNCLNLTYFVYVSPYSRFEDPNFRCNNYV